MDKKKGIIVLLIAVVAVWYFGFRGGCDVATEGHECAADAEHACAKHECTDEAKSDTGSACYVAPEEGDGTEGDGTEGDDADTQ